MPDPNQPTTPAGWYPDGQGGQRWWDGTRWTEHTQPGTPQAQPPAPPAGPTPPQVPGADLPTQVAPNRAADYAAGQPTGYGAPQGAGQYGQPGGPSFGQGYVGSSGGGNGKKIALIGGGVAGLVLLLVIAFVLVGALFGGGPEDVAEEYIDALADADIEKVCELSSKETQEQEFEAYDVDNCDDYVEKAEEEPDFEELEGFEDDFEIDYELGDVTEKDDTAEVDFTSTTRYTGDDEGLKEIFGEEEQESEGTIHLVKEDGDWKVDGNKSDGL